MSNVKLVNEKLICTGDRICTLVESVTNKSLTAVTGVQIQVTPPPGVSYASSNLDQGTYSSSTNTWTIGTMTKGQYLSGEICWTVDDDCLAPFKFNFSLSAGSSSVCIVDSKKDYCIIIDGITKCEIDTFKGIRTITMDETLTLVDHTILANGAYEAVNITLPAPSAAYKIFPENMCVNGGKEYHIKVIDLTNAVTITTPSGKIVDFSTIADASDTYNFSLVGQTVTRHSNGENYFIKTI